MVNMTNVNHLIRLDGKQPSMTEKECVSAGIKNGRVQSVISLMTFNQAPVIILKYPGSSLMQKCKDYYTRIDLWKPFIRFCKAGKNGPITFWD